MIESNVHIFSHRIDETETNASSLQYVISNTKSCQFFFFKVGLFIGVLPEYYQNVNFETFCRLGDLCNFYQMLLNGISNRVH